MLLLGLTSMLFLLFTYAAGWCLRLAIPFVAGSKHDGLMDTFFIGLVGSYVYFNLCSFFVPVNYLVLWPHLLCSIFMWKQWKAAWLEAKARLSFFSRGLPLIILVLFMSSFLFYWISPPINADSADYHYTSIKWYEEYHVVPGLANVHGRYAFNPATFIISAAYSFTGLFGQAIYPMNGTIILMFLLWWFRRTLQQVGFLQMAYFIGGCFLMRQLLVNVPTPSSDALALIVVVYATVQLLDILKNPGVEQQKIFLLFILAIFGITCKLSLFPLLVFILLVWILFRQVRTAKAFVWLAVVSLCIWAPWLCRNYIMCGYFVYPIVETGWLNPDWKCVKEIPALDYIFIHHGAKLFSYDFNYVESLGKWKWIPYWLKAHLKYGRQIDLLAFAMAVLSPLYWLMLYKLKKQKPKSTILLLWCIVYLACFWWMYNSPEYRFGTCFLIMAFLLPFMAFSYSSSAWNHKLNATVYVLAMAFLCAYYIVTLTRMENFRFETWTHYLVMPLKDSRYLHKNNLTDFIRKPLNSDVYLYIADSSHECLNAPLPCQQWKYGTVEMRGKTLQDGFRITKNEVWKYYPYFR
jgi:hypothetical protein